MKVVIELIGNESRENLLATSNYLRELAEGSLPVSTEAKVYGPNDEATANAKTDLDKLADAVVEATKVHEEGRRTRTRSDRRTGRSARSDRRTGRSARTSGRSSRSCPESTRREAC